MSILEIMRCLDIKCKNYRLILVPSKHIIPLVKIDKTPNFCVWTLKPRPTQLWKPGPLLEEVQMQLHWCEGDSSMPLHLAVYEHMQKQQPSASFCSGVRSGKKSKTLSFLTQRFRDEAQIPHSPSRCCTA